MIVALEQVPNEMLTPKSVLHFLRHGHHPMIPSIAVLHVCTHTSQRPRFARDAVDRTCGEPTGRRLYPYRQFPSPKTPNEV